VSFFDPRQRVREAAVPENYCPRNGGEIAAGDALRCYVCGFFTRQSGTLAYAWERTNRASCLRPSTCASSVTRPQAIS
jgi:hypothetical protein